MLKVALNTITNPLINYNRVFLFRTKSNTNKKREETLGRGKGSQDICIWPIKCFHSRDANKMF